MSRIIAFPLVGLSGAMYARLPVTLMSLSERPPSVVMSLIIMSRNPLPRSVTDWLVASWLKSMIVMGFDGVAAFILSLMTGNIF
ncbi:MAG: hypothetical protein BWX45_00333 [Deltaproteobacteria bacterium ADurb.Bin002]|nr:MAG: hypothetical protein BWX45_00333 [Deltaproteobacteria bacterium ADurb.Bin002]